jgi:hypothetical protein
MGAKKKDSADCRRGKTSSEGLIQMEKSVDSMALAGSLSSQTKLNEGGRKLIGYLIMTEWSIQ